MTLGRDNAFVGHIAGFSTQGGWRNTFIGKTSGGANISGGGNTYIGYNSGRWLRGSGNVAIGCNTGPNLFDEKDISDQLFIDNRFTPYPLIHGNFEDRLVTIHQAQTGSAGQNGLRIRRDTISEYWTMHLQQDGDLAFYNSDNSAKMALTQNGDLVISGTLNPPSDVHMKANFQNIDNEEILSKIVQLPITKWNYKNSTDQHIGPMAQDFYVAFGLGQGETTIATVDADGVALSAIQALAAKSDRLEKENKTLQIKNQELENRMARIEELLLSQK